MHDEAYPYPTLPVWRSVDIIDFSQEVPKQPGPGVRYEASSNQGALDTFASCLTIFERGSCSPLASAPHDVTCTQARQLWVLCSFTLQAVLFSSLVVCFLFAEKARQEVTPSPLRRWGWTGPAFVPYTCTLYNNLGMVAGFIPLNSCLYVCFLASGGA